MPLALTGPYSLGGPLLAGWPQGFTGYRLRAVGDRLSTRPPISHLSLGDGLHPLAYIPEAPSTGLVTCTRGLGVNNEH